MVALRFAGKCFHILVLCGIHVCMYVYMLAGNMTSIYHMYQIFVSLYEFMQWCAHWGLYVPGVHTYLYRYATPIHVYMCIYNIIIGLQCIYI